MIASKTYNRFKDPEKLPKLKGDTVVFQCMKNSTDRETKRMVLPTYNVTPTPLIIDPTDPDKGTVQLACLLQAPRPDQPGVPVEIMFEPENNGVIVCRANNAQDRIRYTFLALHPDNEANGGELFRELVAGADERKKVEAMKLDNAANSFAFSVEDTQQAKKLLLGRGIKASNSATLEQLQLQLIDEYKKKPFEEQAAMAVAFDKKMLDELRQLMEAEIVVYDEKKQKLVDVKSDITYEVKIPKNEEDKALFLARAAAANEKLKATLYHQMAIED